MGAGFLLLVPRRGMELLRRGMYFPTGTQTITEEDLTTTIIALIVTEP